MQAIQNVTLNFSGVLVSTTDIKRARRLGRKCSIKALIHGARAHYEITNDGTVLIYAGRELYELKGGK